MLSFICCCNEGLLKNFCQITQTWNEDEKHTTWYAGFVLDFIEDPQVWKVIVFDLNGHQSHGDIVK